MRVLAFVSILVVSSTAQAVDLKRYKVTLSDCYDGDTCTVDFHVSAHVGLGLTLSGTVHKQGVRFCDINAPEIKGGTDVTRLAAQKARDALLSWARAAKVLEVELPQRATCDRAVATCDQQDKYGRWLAYMLADGVNLNKKLLEAGLVADYELKCM